MIAQSNSYPCQNPAFYTLGNTLYQNSPSLQMTLFNELIGVLDGVFRQAEEPAEESMIGELTNEYRVGFSTEYFDGVKTVIITPGNIKNDKKIIYFHGGGYQKQIIIFQLDMAIDIAKRSGSPVYIVDYRLAPDHIFSCAYR